MRSLPRQLYLEINGRRLVVVHGGVTSINRFIFATSAEAIEATCFHRWNYRNADGASSRERSFGKRPTLRWSVPRCAGRPAQAR
jgi:hypothetical protein